jgi:hypothetical protein
LEGKYIYIYITSTDARNMQAEIKNKIAYQIGTLKSFEIHGGSPADYKETLANLRDVIVNSISKEEDFSIYPKLVRSLIDVTSAISFIDTLRMGKDSDEIIKEGKFIQTLASRLLNETGMIILDIITK